MGNEVQTPPQYNGNGDPQRMVSFGEAIQMGFNKYCCFTGRASRSEYWWWCLFTFIVGSVAELISLGIGDWFSYVVSLALCLPGLGLTCRRLHDIGKAAGWIFISLIPLVGAIILIVWTVQPSEPQANRFGPVPNCE